MTAKPTIGRTVLYRLADLDAPGMPRLHPAIITRVWSETCVNLTVFRDGGAILPAVSVDHAPVDGRPTTAGSWSWPVIGAPAAQNTVAVDGAPAAPPVSEAPAAALLVEVPPAPASIEPPTAVVAAPLEPKGE